MAVAFRSLVVLFAVLAVRVMGQQCVSYGIDFANGGSYNIDSTSNNYFSFVTVFQGTFDNRRLLAGHLGKTRRFQAGEDIVGVIHAGVAPLSNTFASRMCGGRDLPRAGGPKPEPVLVLRDSDESGGAASHFHMVRPPLV